MYRRAAQEYELRNRNGDRIYSLDYIMPHFFVRKIPTRVNYLSRYCTLYAVLVGFRHFNKVSTGFLYYVIFVCTFSRVHMKSTTRRIPAVQTTKVYSLINLYNHKEGYLKHTR